MEEEFLESDVVFSDIHQPIQLGETNNKPKQRRRIRGGGGGGGGHGQRGQSPPLDIPEATRYHYYYYDDDDEDNEDLRVPPHVIVARRINNYYNVSRKMACSICIEDEKGRILKGRNLCEVRNSILRLTGFYET